jgi:hypothetical protein
MCKSQKLTTETLRATEEDGGSRFHGEFRWTPVVNERTNTTRGVVRLEVDGRSTIIYEWNSPDTVTHEFEIPLGQYLVNSSGEYRITWLFKSGSSGICVARSEVTA